MLFVLLVFFSKSFIRILKHFAGKRRKVYIIMKIYINSILWIKTKFYLFHSIDYRTNLSVNKDLSLEKVQSLIMCLYTWGVHGIYPIKNSFVLFNVVYFYMDLKQNMFLWSHIVKTLNLRLNYFRSIPFTDKLQKQLVNASCCITAKSRWSSF